MLQTLEKPSFTVSNFKRVIAKDDMRIVVLQRLGLNYKTEKELIFTLEELKRLALYGMTDGFSGMIYTPDNAEFYDLWCDEIADYLEARWSDEEFMYEMKARRIALGEILDCSDVYKEALVFAYVESIVFEILDELGVNL